MDEKFAYLALIPAAPASVMRGLQLIQSQEGFISDAAVAALCTRFHCTISDVESILNFYPQFKRVRPGEIRIELCRGSACRAHHAEELKQWITELTAGKKEFSVEETDCLGACCLAPALRINGKVCGKLDKSRLSRILNECNKKEMT